MSDRKLYLIDFDGTITKEDSLFHFLAYSLSVFQILKTLLFFAPIFIFNKIGVIDNSKSKELLLRICFKSTNEEIFDKKSVDFSNQKLQKLVRKSFLDFNSNLDGQSEVVIVSASIKNYLKPWCDQYGFELLCTELGVKDGLITGNFSTPNCNGAEKVKRITEKYDLSGFDEIHVYGNSKGDLPMMGLGTHRYYRFFK